MVRYSGGQKVGKGTYWNFDNGERVDISAEGILAGGKDKIYYRLPAAGILLAGPFIGLLYAAFLPFIGFAMAIKVVMQKLASGIFGTAVKGASFSWRPSESYLAGKRKSREEKKEENGKDEQEKGD